MRAECGPPCVPRYLSISRCNGSAAFSELFSFFFRKGKKRILLYFSFVIRFSISLIHSLSRALSRSLSLSLSLPLVLSLPLNLSHSLTLSHSPPLTPYTYISFHLSLVVIISEFSLFLLRKHFIT